MSSAGPPTAGGSPGTASRSRGAASRAASPGTPRLLVPHLRDLLLGRGARQVGDELDLVIPLWPGNSGLRRSSSAQMQPAAQTSTAAEYRVVRADEPGARTICRRRTRQAVRGAGPGGAGAPGGDVVRPEDGVLADVGKSARASPKSQICGGGVSSRQRRPRGAGRCVLTFRSQFALTGMFPGLRSRWNTFAACMWRRPANSWYSSHCATEQPLRPALAAPRAGRPAHLDVDFVVLGLRPDQVRQVRVERLEHDEDRANDVRRGQQDVVDAMMFGWCSRRRKRSSRMIGWCRPCRRAPGRCA